MDHSFFAMLTILAIASYGAGRIRAHSINIQGTPLNSPSHDHGRLVALVNVATALFAYFALLLLFPAIRAWLPIGLGLATTAWLVFWISPDFRAGKLFDWLIGWLVMAASAVIVVVAVGFGLSAIFKNLQYIY